MNPFVTKNLPVSSYPESNYLPSAKNSKKLFPLDISAFRKDDWILLSIIAVLVMEGSRDYVLLCALGYLFIMGFKEPLEK